MIEQGTYMRVKHQIRGLTASKGEVHRCFIQSLTEYYSLVKHEILIQYQNMDALVHATFWCYTVFVLFFILHVLIDAVFISI